MQFTMMSSALLAATDRPLKTAQMLIGALLRVPAQAIQRRIIKELNRRGDNAPMSLIELV